MIFGSEISLGFKLNHNHCGLPLVFSQILTKKQDIYDIFNFPGNDRVSHRNIAHDEIRKLTSGHFLAYSDIEIIVKPIGVSHWLNKRRTLKQKSDFNRIFIWRICKEPVTSWSLLIKMVAKQIYSIWFK